MDLAIFNLCGDQTGGASELSLLREYPLDDSLLAVTRIWGSASSQELIVATKGAPETIFKLCAMDREQERKHLLALHKMAERGFRVLGVAGASQKPGGFPDHPSAFSFSFIGLLGFEDPVRPEMDEAMKRCQQAGLMVVMITGDHPATARQVAQRIGLAADVVLTGEELAAASDTSLAELVKSVRVFARITPDQKLRLVRAFHKNGEVVAMMGDGVNDAPALKAADIGVAMGKRGTDVAREAADLVLMDDNFFSVVQAIALGRRVYDNLQKAMLYILSIHIPIVGLVLVPAFWPGLPIIMLPVQIVFLELIIDPVCSVAFESQPAERDVMRRPPRGAQELFFSSRCFWTSLLFGVLLLVAVLVVYLISLLWGFEERMARGAAFSALVIGNLLLISSLLSFSRPAFLGVLTNKTALLFLLIAFLLLVAIFSFSFLQDLFKVSAPTWALVSLVLIVCFFFLLFVELLKRSRHKKSRAES